MTQGRFTLTYPMKSKVKRMLVESEIKTKLPHLNPVS